MSAPDAGGVRDTPALAPVRVLPAGPHALLVELADGEHAEAFHAELLRRRERGELPGVREIVPAARTVLLDGILEGTGAHARGARVRGPGAVRPRSRLVAGGAAAARGP